MSKMLLRLRQEQSWDVEDAIKTGAKAELGMLKILLRLRQEWSWAC